MIQPFILPGTQIGGQGGNPFDDSVTTNIVGIHSITITGDVWIDSMQITYNTYSTKGSGTTESPVHGNNTKGSLYPEIIFSPGEMIYQIQASFDVYINSLKICTILPDGTKNVYPKTGCYGTQHDNYYEINGPIVCFYGSSDQALDNLGVFYIISLPYVYTTIGLLDVWGEGYINDHGQITGFKNSQNLNKYNQKVSNGPNRGKPIPNLIPVDDWDSPKFPIADGMISNLTLMGAPINVDTAKEMYRVLDKTDGVVLLYDLEEASIDTFESNMGQLMYQPNAPLNPPYNTPTLRPVRIYGFSAITDHN